MDHTKRVVITKVAVRSIAVAPSVSSPVATLEANKRLSVDASTVAASVSIPLGQKAEKLLNSQHDMSSAPGQPEETRMVLSHS